MWKFIASIILTSLVLIDSKKVSAQTFTWDGGGDGTSWSDPLNWDLDSGFPQDGADLVFISSGTPILNASYSLDELNLSGGTLNIGAFTLTMDDEISLTGGTISSSNGTISGSGTTIRSTNTTMTGDITFSSSADIDINTNSIFSGGNVSIIGTGGQSAVFIDGIVSIGGGGGNVTITNRDRNPVTWTGTLTMAGNVTINNNGTNNSSDLIILGNANDALTVNGNLVLNNNTTNSASELRLANASNTLISITDDLEVNNSTSIVYFNQPIDPTSTTTVGGSFSTSGFSAGTLHLNYVDVTGTDASGTFNANFKAEGTTLRGNITVNTGGNIDIDDTSLLGSNITLNHNSNNGNRLAIDGNITMGDGTGSITLSTSSRNSETWEGNHTYNGDLTITHSGTNNSSSLTLLNNVSDDFIVDGDVTFNNNTTNSNSTAFLRPANAGNSYFRGNITTASSSGKTVDFGESGGNIIIDGNTDQSLNGLTNGNAPEFGNVEINKTFGGFTLNADMIITSNIDFQNGIINSDGTNTLIIQDNATATNASDASYVNGIVRKIGNDAFTFPVGASDVYLPISITSPNNTNDIFEASYSNSAAAGAFDVADPDPSGEDLFYASVCGHWGIQQTNGSDAVDITFAYKSYDSGCDEVSAPADLRIAQLNAGTWENAEAGISGSGSGTGSISISNISVTTQTTFALASVNTSMLNILPIELVSFEANVHDNTVLINWTTTSEIDHDYFEVQHSQDGYNFETIGRVDGIGGGAGLWHYQFTDEKLRSGINYYRLKSIDIDGSIEFSKIAAVHLPEIKFDLFPNPVSSVLNIQVGEHLQPVIWELSNANGNAVKRGEIPQNILTEKVSFSSLPKSIYFLKVQYNGIIFYRKVICVK